MRRIMIKRITSVAVVFIELCVCYFSSLSTTSCSRESMTGEIDSIETASADVIFLDTEDKISTEAADTNESFSQDVISEIGPDEYTSSIESDPESGSVQTNDQRETDSSVSTNSTTPVTSEPETSEKTPKPVDPPEEKPSVDLDTALSRSFDFLCGFVSDVGYGQEWIVLALETGGRGNEAIRQSYVSSVTATVMDKLSSDDRSPASALDKHKATENARVILALLSVGSDPYNVAGYDLVSALYDTEWVCRATLNNPIYALIALDACKDENNAAKNALIDHILGRQLGDGGWALSGTKADPDVTAMALLALYRHRERSDVASSAARAIGVLSAIQLETGEYRSWGRVNSESISQVIIALCAWGIDPSTDARFIKNGVSALDALLIYTTDNGFADTLGSSGFVADTSIMASEQAALALNAYRRFVSGNGAIFDFG